MRSIMYIWLWLLVVLAPLVAQAHPLDITSTTARFEDGQVVTETRMTARQVGLAFLGRETDLSPDDMLEVKADIREAYIQHMRWQTDRGDCAARQVAVDIPQEEVAQLLLEGVTARAVYYCGVVPRGALRLTATLFVDSFPDQRNVVVLNPGEAQHVLTAHDTTLEWRPERLEAAPEVVGGVWESFWRFVGLGVEHVAIGYDHILFMVGIYLVVRRLRQLLAVVTSFTIAHTITLVAATLGWISLPSVLVEAAIAATIVYIGIENIVKREFRHRALITFGLGLVHGLGFSSVLRELGISGRFFISNLIGFNVGVEVGQLVIVLLLLPLMWWLERHPRINAAVVYWVSVGISIVGLVWFLQRIEGVIGFT